MLISNINHLLYFTFCPRDAIHSAGICDSNVSVRPSVTAGIVSKTETDSVMISSPSDSLMISLSGQYDSSKNSQGVTPSEGDLWEWSGFQRAIFAIVRPISRRISETVQDTTKVTVEH